MPKRKFQQGRQNGGGTSAKDAQEEDEHDADVEEIPDQHEEPEPKTDGVRDE